MLSSGHLVDDHAERPDVAWVRVVHALQALWRPTQLEQESYIHVAESAGERAGVFFRLFVLVQLLADAEVAQLCKPKVGLHKDVVGLQVSMDLLALIVHESQGLQQLQEENQD